MENFDAVGALADARRRPRRRRDADVLADGTAVDGVAELRAALLRDPDVFVGTFTEKLMTYALGRGLQHYDMPVVREIVRETPRTTTTGSQRSCSAIVDSAPFRMRVKRRRRRLTRRERDVQSRRAIDVHH